MKPKYAKTYRTLALGLAATSLTTVAFAADGVWTTADGGGVVANWSDTANWDSAIVADGTDSVATFGFGTPNNTTAVIVDTDITIGSLVYSNNSSVSDFNLRGSTGNTLTFATTTGVPMIEVTAASNRLLSLGNGGTLNIGGTQGLTLRASAGGALTGTGVDATSSLPSKAIRVQSIDVTALTGGITVDRGYAQLRSANQLGSGASTQGLTVGTADTVTFDRLAGVNFVQDTQVTTLDGNSLGRIWSNGKTFTVGVNDATGGDFGGVFGVDFGGTVGTNHFIKTGTGTQIISGRIDTLGDLTVNDGTLTLSGTGNSVAELDGAAAGTLSLGSGSDLTINDVGGNYFGALTGTGTLNIDTGNTSLVQRFNYNANNTFSGDIVVKSGLLDLRNTGGQAVLGNNAVAIQLGEAGETDDATLRFSHRGSLGAGQIVTVVGGGTNTIVGNRNNTGQVTFTRGVVLSDADVNIEHTGRSGYRIQDGITGTGNVTFLGNTINTGGANDIAVRSEINNTGTITNSGTGDNNLNINGANGGSIGANVTGIIQNNVSSDPALFASDFIIDANNSAFTGTADVISGTMRLLNTNGLSANNVVSVDTNGILDVQNGVTIAGLNDGTGGGTVTNESATDRTLTLGGSGAYAFNGAIVDGATNKLSVTTSGSGTHELGGSNTYTGLTTINSGTTLKLGSASALGSSVDATDGTDLNSGGILDLNGQTTAESFTDISGTFINSNTTAAAAISTEMVQLGNLKFDGDGDITISNVRRTDSNQRRITKNGTGTLTLAGSANNSRYGLTVNEGNVFLDKPDGVDAVARYALIMNNASGTVKLLAGNQIHDSLDANGSHQINAGTLDLNGFDEGIARIDTLDTDGVVTNNDGGTTSTLTLLGGSIDATFAGTVTGNLNLVKDGTNTQTLTGTNTHTGTTTINSGTLAIGSGGTTGSLSGAVVNNSVLAFNRSNNLTIANDISGTGSLELTLGGGDSTLSGTNSYQGGTTINSGNVRLSNDGNLGATSGALTLNGGGIKNNDTNTTLDAARNVEIGASGGTMTAGWSKDLTASGVVSGSGDLTIVGDSGTVVLSNAANTYSGEINLEAATSKLSVASLGAGATVTGNAGATYTITTSDANAFAAASGFTGTTILSDTVSIGTQTITTGTLTFGAASVFDLTDTLTVESGATVNFESGFGVEDITSLSSSTIVGTYVLINGDGTIDTTNLSNFGISNAFNLGGGLIAYFQEGSLELVVAVPEPSTFALFAGALALGSVMMRRRRS